MANDTPNFDQIKVGADAANESISTFTKSLSGSLNVIQSLSNFSVQASKSFVDLGSSLKKISEEQRNNILLTQQQTNLFGLMAAGVLGASKSFNQFENQLKSDGLYTFSNQVNEMVASAERAASPIKALGEIASSLGIKAFRGVGEDIGKFTGRLKDTILAYAESADAALKLQTGFLHLSSASGEFSKVVDAAGPNLKNLNNLLFNQAQVITSAAQATNTETKSVVEYYNELGKLPGYLNSQISATDSAGNRMNMLTGAIKLAHGTGQDFKTVLGDMTEAFNNYNASGDKALEFTARIADLSQKYNIQIEDTRRFMDGMSDSFKYVGENVESSSKIFNRFFMGLRDSGLSTRATVDILNDMTKSLSNMSIAQKAFLSARTGGPGGLLGAVQIEKDLREGRADEVMKRVEQTLKQQFGRIVTQKEGATSEGTAQQFIKQRMFLQQGPFGQLTGGDEQKATRLLEALAKPGGYDAKQAGDLLRTDIQRGTDIENKSYTQLSKSNIHLESIRMFAGITALNTTQRSFTGATSNNDLQRQLQGSLINAMKAGTEASRDSGKKQQDDKSSHYFTTAIKDLETTAGSLGLSMKSAGQTMGSIVNTNKETTPTKTTTVNMADAHTHRTQTAPTPQNITVQVVGVCPDCHKKFVTHQGLQTAAVTSGAPHLGPNEPGF